MTGHETRVQLTGLKFEDITEVRADSQAVLDSTRTGVLEVLPAVGEVSKFRMGLP